MVDKFIAAVKRIIFGDGAKLLAKVEATAKQVQQDFEKAGRILQAEQRKLENEAIILKSKASVAAQKAEKAVRVAARYAEMHS